MRDREPTAALRAYNRQIQFLTETFPEGIVYQYTVTAEGQRLLTYLGRGAERIFGERPHQLPVEIEWLTARILPEDEPGIAEAGEISRRELSRFSHDVRIRALDGTERWVSIRTQPRELDDGSVVWDGVILDTTARHRDEEAVRRQVGFLRALNQTTLELLDRRQVPDLLKALTERAAALLRSPQAEISLLQGDELVVRAFSGRHEYVEGERGRRGEATPEWRAILSREPVVVDRFAEHPESREIHRAHGIHAVAVFPILRGEVCAGVLGLARDQPGQPFTPEDVQEGALLARMAALVLHNAAIHEEAVREAEERTAALRESEARFRVLADVSPVGIFSSDPAGRTVFVNRRWCEIAGLTPQQAMGDGWKTALHPDDREGVARSWEEAVRHGESSAAEFRFVRPDGTITWLVGQSRAQFHRDGTLCGYVGTITDVTNLKRAEDERQRLDAQSRQSRKMESLGTLAGGIAHDFNNILTGTFGFLDLARLELPADHPAMAWLDRIGTSSERARELVRQILTFSRKNEGERVVQRMHIVIGEALRLLRSTLPPMVELHAHVAADAPPVLADATQIHQVVLNLCTNAWHALPPKGGRILVKLEPFIITPEQGSIEPDLRPGPVVRLSVSDNGCGMDAATLDQIYEPFFTTKGTGAGTGLGLAVVHGIVRSHGGAITVRSVVGEGTTFDLYFPVATVAMTPLPDVPPRPPRGKGERILVVDDDSVSGFAVEKMIESVGYAVTRYLKPEEALAHFTASPSSYDLVVSDLAMPGMNGAELVEHMVRIRPDLPVIIVTGYIETARQKMLEKSAARAVLRKPVSRDELARTIAHHLATGRI